MSSNEKQVLEASLFMASGSLTLKELKETTGIMERIEIISLLKELKNDYVEKNSGLEIIIDRENDSFSMRVKPELQGKVNHFAAESDLNKGVQKTLALISYKQPIIQSKVVKYRNTKAYDHVKELLEKGFISRQKYGRTYILKTTKKFLDYFGELKQK